ncbi:P5-type ATPase cation transporter-domain-containing protein [Pilobolus umbonatus]|nr:P5-type ATPase cation transporter-domain-containing protein [Pilobolus umbonatus]
MSTPSNQPRAIYGTSSLESSRASSPIVPDKVNRRDSTVPLINAPPVQLNEPIEPSSYTGSSTRHTNRTGLFRRRPNNDEQSETESESDVELNTSDENIDTESESESVHSRDISQHKMFISKNDTRISGLNEIPTDTKDEQILLLEEEDVYITIAGYKHNRLNLFLYQLMCVLSLGIVWLLFRWVPTWYVSWVGIKVPLKDAEWLVFKSQYNEIEIIRPHREFYNGSVGSVFSYDQIKAEIRQLSVHSDDARQLLNMDEIISQLILVEYRYNRLGFHPLLNKFLIIGFWKDQSWNSLKSMKSGLSSEKYRSRLSVFGPNLINIREKPTSKLLTDEVLNPFYVFQIGSILLWCMDDYYYYAFCIFIISAFSILSSLVETKQVIMIRICFYICV